MDLWKHTGNIRELFVWDCIFDQYVCPWIGGRHLASSFALYYFTLGLGFKAFKGCSNLQIAPGLFSSFALDT